MNKSDIHSFDKDLSTFSTEEPKNYYIFDEEEELVESIYIPVTLFSKSYAVIDIPEDEELTTGFKEATIEIDSQSLPGYEFENKGFSNYALLYLMDETGTSNFINMKESKMSYRYILKRLRLRKKKFINVKRDKYKPENHVCFIIL